MASDVRWIIKKADGQLLQSFSIDPRKIRVGWFSPDAPGKTNEGKKARSLCGMKREPLRFWPRWPQIFLRNFCTQK
ncbi:hypothetical protein [Pseudomonas savastanoi]|uniref:hypothetical protein n=1 Tax=Pseudomonas savastanoi TaxID=29438 RepID=UPI0001F70996|nr:hypothetical protein [Pseudomonas savastanoi]EFW87875.1 hypothetical protein PsgRace4_00015 [Pseudomonas savastanoi pv. glycinea str. race 4]